MVYCASYAMDVASISQAFSRPEVRVVATAVDRSRPTKKNSTSIRYLLREYSPYAREVRERTQYIAFETVLSTHIAKTIQIKFWVNYEQLESAINLSFISSVDSYDDLEDAALRMYLQSRGTCVKDIVISNMLDNIFKEHLQVDMTYNEDLSRIENLSVSNKSII